MNISRKIAEKKKSQVCRNTGVSTYLALEVLGSFSSRSRTGPNRSDWVKKRSTTFENIGQMRTNRKNREYFANNRKKKRANYVEKPWGFDVLGSQSTWLFFFTGPNRYKQVRTGPKTFKNVRNIAKIANISRKTEKFWRNIAF